MIYFPPQMNSSNFSTLTLPLMVTVTIPSRPSLTLGAGGYYAFTMDQDQDVGSYYYDNTGEKLQNDMGFVYMLRLSYPLQERLELFVRGRYRTGRRAMTEWDEYKHGYSDITAGLVYNIGHGKNEEETAREDAGAVNENIFLTWRAGVVTLWNSGNIARDKYSPLVAPSAGFSLNLYDLNDFENFWLFSDLHTLFVDHNGGPDSKGFRLSDHLLPEELQVGASYNVTGTNIRQFAGGVEVSVSVRLVCNAFPSLLLFESVYYLWHKPGQ
jgi:hypothetical protein